jgi:hypothetical protein
MIHTLILSYNLLTMKKKYLHWNKKKGFLTLTEVQVDRSGNDNSG